MAGELLDSTSGAGVGVNVTYSPEGAVSVTVGVGIELSGDSGELPTSVKMPAAPRAIPANGSTSSPFRSHGFREHTKQWGFFSVATWPPDGVPYIYVVHLQSVAQVARPGVLLPPHNGGARVYAAVGEHALEVNVLRVPVGAPAGHVSASMVVAL
jgi:hypothetical protein